MNKRRISLRQRIRLCPTTTDWAMVVVVHGGHRASHAQGLNAPVLSPSLQSEGVRNWKNCARTRMNIGIERIVTTGSNR